MDDTPVMSRGMRSDPNGKCTEEIRAKVPGDLHAKVAALAALAGMSSSEYCRDVLESHVYGEFSRVQSMAHRGRTQRES